MAKKRTKKRQKKDSVQKNMEWKERLPVLKFTGAFFIITLLFFLLTNSDWFDIVRSPLLNIYTSLSSLILNLFGFGTSANGDILTSSQFSVNIEEGCDAIAPAILYAASILVFPIAWRWKWQGLLYGLLAIFILNIFRIISLFLTGIYVQSLFEIMHVEVWQVIFIVTTVVFWLYWLRWANSRSQNNARPE